MLSLSLPCFNKSKIAVIGDLILDEYIDCSVDRVSPEAPVLIAQIDSTKFKHSLGGAANTAKNVRQLGASTTLFGVIGDDASGKLIKSLCKESDIDLKAFVVQGKDTIKKTRIRKDNFQLIRLDYESKEGSYELMNIRTLLEKVYENIEEYNAIIISDYNKGTLPKALCLDIIDRCNSLGIPTFVDPKGTNWSKYDKATCLTPNLKEFQQMTSNSVSITNPANFISSAKEILKDFALDFLLVTQGKDGISYIDHNNYIHKYADAEQVFDVSGAGDTVISTFALSIINNVCIDEAIDLANLAAKVVIKKVGTQAITYEELENEVRFHSKCHNTNKMYNIEELKRLTSSWREKNFKITFTNGCFDLLHYGHINLLNNASNVGDKLIVAINSDESIKRIKGSSRPVICEEQRASIISMIRGVDAVIIYKEDTPLNLIKTLAPDFLVKGGEYKDKEIVGKEFLESIGHSVLVFPTTQGISTTTIINNIKGGS